MALERQVTSYVVKFMKIIFIESFECVRDVKRVFLQYHVHLSLLAVHAVMDLCNLAKQPYNR